MMEYKAQLNTFAIEKFPGIMLFSSHLNRVLQFYDNISGMVTRCVELVKLTLLSKNDVDKVQIFIGTISFFFVHK